MYLTLASQLVLYTFMGSRGLMDRASEVVGSNLGSGRNCPRLRSGETLEQGTEPPTAPRALHRWLLTAPGVCALGWVKCRAQTSLLVLLCIIFVCENKEFLIYNKKYKTAKSCNFFHNTKTHWATLCKNALPGLLLWCWKLEWNVKFLSCILPALSFSSHHSVLSPAIAVKAICLVLQIFILSRSSYGATWPRRPPISPHSALVRSLFTSQTTSFLFRFPIKHMGAR